MSWSNAINAALHGSTKSSMSRRPDHIPKRKPFPVAVRREVTQRSGGICEADGCTNPGSEYDHITPVGLGGKSDLGNCKLLCSTCHPPKTRRDVAEIARADRKGGRSGRRARKERAKAKGTYKPMPSRAFSKAYKRGLDGKVTKRESNDDDTSH